MSVLIVKLPPRPRTDTEAAHAEFDWLYSSDGATVARRGRSAGAAMPRAEQIAAVVADEDVAWHRTPLPKAPSARLRAALGGVLEDELLDDEDAVHLAVEPGAVAGQPCWVAAMHKAWLGGLVAALERSGVPLDRVAPLSWPQPSPALHFVADRHGDEDAPLAVLSHADGVVALRMGGTLARSRVAPLLADPALRCSAEPAAAAAAERWLQGGPERPVAIVTDAERALAALRSAWNLRQFDLAPRHRGMRLLRDAWRHARAPAWRPVRIGLAALLGVNLLALNAWAWHLQRTEADKRTQMTALLREAHPQVRAVIDAPAQMKRETDLLRSSAGRAGEADLEPLLAAAAAAWPDGQPPVQTLRYEPGKLTLSAAGWNDAQAAAFRDRLEAAGYTAEVAPTQVVVRRG